MEVDCKIVYSFARVPGVERLQLRRRGSALEPRWNVVELGNSTGMRVDRDSLGKTLSEIGGDFSTQGNRRPSRGKASCRGIS